MRSLLFAFLSLVPLLSMAQVQDSIKASTDSFEGRFRPNKPDPIIKYKSTSVSLPYRKVRDEGHTPLIHRGPSIQVACYNERWRTKGGVTKSITKFEMLIGVGLLKTNKKAVSAITSASTLYMEVNYHYMRPVKQVFGGKGTWYLGGILTNTFDGRYYSFLPNNSFGYEFSNVINPATHINYSFQLGKNNRNYEAGFKLNFALLAHVIRPNYIGMEPAAAYMEEKIKPLALFTHGNTIALPNRFFRINTEIYLDRFKKSNNDKFRFFYGWGLHVTKLQDSNPLYIASHTVGVVAMIYSKKDKKIKNTKKVDFQ